jgi:signal transduction histidine kinase
LKFTPGGGKVTISAYAANFYQNGIGDQAGYITIAVTDTGVGMSQEVIDKLFRIDVNHSTPGTDNEQGTGLGLIICKEMVERNNGQIWVESRPNQGTTIAFTVPTASEPDTKKSDIPPAKIWRN